MSDLKKKDRESNFELLRIVAIILIILSHFNVHSGFTPESTPTVIYLITRVFALGCVSNFIFLLISGYFLIKSKPNFKKIIGLVVELYFYSFVIAGIALLIRGGNPTTQELKSTIFAFPFGPWFISMYIIFYLFTPFINKMLLNLSEKEHKRLLLISLIVFSIMPTISFSHPFSDLSVFFLAYMTGAYIGLYLKNLNRNKLIKILLLSFIALAILVVGNYLISKFINMHSVAYLVPTSIVMNASIIPVYFGTLIFLIFREIKIKHNALINRIASSVLGIYLIHENVFVSDFIFKKTLFINPNTTNPFLFCILALAKVALIFLVCLAIDQMRQLLFKYISSAFRKHRQS